MGYKLFLDDIRTVKMVYPNLSESDFVIVRSYKAFIDEITKNGLPEFISFDNDLGEDSEHNILPDGYSCAKWLVYESGIDLRRLDFKVHSANPIAKEQIKSILNNYIKHLNSSK